MPYFSNRYMYTFIDSRHWAVSFSSQLVVLNTVGLFPGNSKIWRMKN